MKRASLDPAKTNHKSFTSYHNSNNVILIKQYVFWAIPSFPLMTPRFNHHPGIKVSGHQEKCRADQNAYYLPKSCYCYIMYIKYIKSTEYCVFQLFFYEAIQIIKCSARWNGSNTIRVFKKKLMCLHLFTELFHKDLSSLFRTNCSNYQYLYYLHERARNNI